MCVGRARPFAFCGFLRALDGLLEIGFKEIRLDQENGSGLNQKIAPVPGIVERAAGSGRFNEGQGFVWILQVGFVFNVFECFVNLFLNILWANYRSVLGSRALIDVRQNNFGLFFFVRCN